MGHRLKSAIFSFFRKSLFVGVHKKLLYAVDCFADERILRMDVRKFYVRKLAIHLFVK